jgi:uncharacterized membrane protein
MSILDRLNKLLPASRSGLGEKPESVMDSLRRQGGEATPEELAHDTQLPISTIEQVAEDLGERGLVDVSADPSIPGLQFIRVKR